MASWFGTVGMAAAAAARDEGRGCGLVGNEGLVLGCLGFVEPIFDCDKRCVGGGPGLKSSLLSLLFLDVLSIPTSKVKKRN